jgi:hypothetical protein
MSIYEVCVLRSFLQILAHGHIVINQGHGLDLLTLLPNYQFERSLITPVLFIRHKYKPLKMGFIFFG